MRLTIEFPMNVVRAYNGASRLDETLDDNISYLIGKHCYDSNIEFEILNLNFVDSEPNVNDELISYQVRLGIDSSEFQVDWILKELENEKFEKGLTIKSENGDILYGDPYSADLQHRRELKNNKQTTTKSKLG